MKAFLDILEVNSFEQTNYDFNILFFPEKNIKVCINYNGNVFEELTIERLAGHLNALIGSVVDKPQTNVHMLNILTEEEKTLVIEKFNNTQTEYPRFSTLTELFEEQVRKEPDSIAVIFEDKKLTYLELNTYANKLAYKLRKLGVKPDDFVAIIAERSIEMLIGILGIIKSGGAYVPIDVHYPQDRIEYIISDCKPKAILLYNAIIDTEIPVIDLAGRDIFEDGISQNPEKINTSNDLVYMIYTSGTTGRPKGVMITHTSLVNYLYYAKDAYLNDTPPVVPLFSNICFDLTVTSLFLPIIAGGAMIIYKDEADVALNKIFRNKEITLVKLHLRI